MAKLSEECLGEERDLQRVGRLTKRVSERGTFSGERKACAKVLMQERVRQISRSCGRNRTFKSNTVENEVKDVPRHVKGV